MKADFEKGTKVCPMCKKELSIEMFCNDKNNPDGLNYWCKQCAKSYRDKTRNTFNGERKTRRGNSVFMKRDYELTEEQLNKRECGRRYRKDNKNENPHAILIWYDEKINKLDDGLYRKIYRAEYNRQKRCAMLGYIGRKKPSEHFLFDFDLEQMLKDNVYVKNGKYNEYITKWWDGEIRHWTVNDGIWKKENSSEVKEEENSMSKNKSIKIIDKKEETLFSQLKVGDCFILKNDSDSELYMKTAEVRFKNALICNSVNLNNGRYLLFGSIDEITKVSVDITAKVK